MLAELASPDLWAEFYAYKTSRGLMTNPEREALARYIDEQGYMSIARGLADGRIGSAPPPATAWTSWAAPASASSTPSRGGKLGAENAGLSAASI